MIDGWEPRVRVDVLPVHELQRVPEHCSYEAPPVHAQPPVVCRVFLSPELQHLGDTHQRGGAEKVSPGFACVFLHSLGLHSFMPLKAAIALPTFAFSITSAV